MEVSRSFLAKKCVLFGGGILSSLVVFCASVIDYIPFRSKRPEFLVPNCKSE